MLKGGHSNLKTNFWNFHICFWIFHEPYENKTQTKIAKFIKKTGLWFLSEHNASVIYL